MSRNRFYIALVRLYDIGVQGSADWSLPIFE